jgi:dipeptidyl aminopeptidase/acylaminoacyl peptidase
VEFATELRQPDEIKTVALPASAALEARGVPTQLLVFDDEGHGIIKLKNKLVMYPIVVEFLDQHLKG